MNLYKAEKPEGHLQTEVPNSEEVRKTEIGLFSFKSFVKCAINISFSSVPGFMFL